MASNRYSHFHQQLQCWYEIHGRRDLPWRNTHDAYAVYVSEIMLQQTQVKTVLERFYFPFLARFPTLDSLALAPEEAVLSQWQGLGYYSRARNLHQAAKQCGGTLPDYLQALLALPGIGQNTAHAILAFAFHQPYAVLEANVKRVLHRIFALEQTSAADLWHKADALLNRQNPFDYNQAMMDLGAMICTPKQQDCPACPAAAICKGKREPERYPAKRAPKTVPVRTRSIIALRDEAGRIHATPRQTRFLNGMYGFIELMPDATHLTHRNQTLAVSDMTPLGRIQQTYSHFQLDGSLYLADWPARENGPDWYEMDALAALPMSKADEKTVALIVKYESNLKPSHEPAKRSVQLTDTAGSGDLPKIKPMSLQSGRFNRSIPTGSGDLPEKN